MLFDKAANIVIMCQQNGKHVRHLLRDRAPVNPDELKRIQGLEHLSGQELADAHQAIECMARIIYRILKQQKTVDSNE